MSIVFQQEDTTYQAGDLLGNISHQGVLGSNLSGTESLPPTFPTTSTGSSLGHYHYTEPVTNALQFLNVSGSGTGGHKFYTANSTTAPVNTASIGLDGFTIDKSVAQGEPILLSLPNVSNSIDIACIMSSDVSIPPFNMTPNNSIWPVRVNSNCTNMNTGVTYYAKVFNGTTLQLNTSPTGGVPTIIDTADLASRPQPILSLITGYNPLPQIINIFETLTITTNTDESILSATDITFNGNSLLEEIDILQVKQTTPNLQYISAAITADARPPIAPTSTITQTYAFTPAWYFKNSFSSGINKINWYIGGDIGMTVSDVLGLYMNIFNPSMTSNDDCPFIIIYTANDSVPPVNFYKSKRTYLFNQSVTPVINTRYLMFSDVSSTCPTPSTYGSVLNNMELSTVAGTNVGAFAPTEVILAFSIQTNSASVLNSVEFAVNKFGIMTPTGTQEALFIPSL